MRVLSTSMTRSILVIVLTLFMQPTFSEDAVLGGSTSDLPPIRTEVKYVQDQEEKNDDPNKAWEEWGESEKSRRNPFPKRQRNIEVGMDINTIMGMAMRQPKVVLAVLSEEYGSTESVGQAVTAKFKNQLAAAGIGCKLWFVLQGRQVVANCETIRDGHMAKDYMIRRPEIIRTVLDNVPFTPRPSSFDDDDDEEDDRDDEQRISNAESVGGDIRGGSKENESNPSGDREEL